MAIEFEGFDELIKELADMGNAETTTKALNEAGLLLVRAARQNAPKGELRNSIDVEVDGLTAKVFTPLEYAPYVEYGTGLYAEGEGGGRKEVPWVYIEGSTNDSHKKTIHTEESADKAVAFLRSKGLDARKTSGQKPQPYMRPALDENRENIIEIFRKVMRDD